VSDLNDQDLEQIRAHGLSPAEVERQLRYFRRRPRGIRLKRPARLEDGIVQLAPEAWPRLEARYGEAAARGRFSKFVPASGAATRMFRALLANLNGEVSDQDRAAGRRFLDAFDDFPFAGRLRAEAVRHGLDVERLRAAGDPLPLLHLLLTEAGLDLGHISKALIPFHVDGDTARSPLEEHLYEAMDHLADACGSCRIHFTIPQHQEQVFRDHLRAAQEEVERRSGGSVAVDWSVQSPATDTIAVDLEGQLFRQTDGSLVLRPGGHGALLRNLHEMAGDLVFVRNIDNVLPECNRPAVVAWNRRLGGYLLELEDWVASTLERLDQASGAGPEDAPFLTDALRELAARLGQRDALAQLERPPAAQRAFLRERLDRPLRVAGVVVNKGEPGGGPFWVEDDEGESLQIVEASQIDKEDAGQAEILQASTHFNPVHLVCRVRSHRGELYDLESFVDPATAFISRKSQLGRPLLALEHPGLWNGAMARWNTLFVEIPATIFAPVKTVFDLLRPEHQAKSPETATR
jgi:hypothetical protein